MMALFTYPLMWFATITIPILVSIYFLHRHYRQRKVSSLMLWVEGRELSSGGKTIKKLSFPWIFLLELIIIILLILAGLGLRYNTIKQYHPTAIILDNSISMQALSNNEKKVKDISLAALQKIISNPKISIIRTIIAGTEIIPIKAKTKPELLSMIKKNWDCNSSSADIPLAIASLKRTNPSADIIVVSDHKPPANFIETGGVIWLASGKPQNNMAIINAVRNKSSATHTRILIQVANYSTKTKTATIQWITNNKIIKTDTITIPAEKYKTIEHILKKTNDDITIRIKELDALPIDNSVTLIPAPAKNLRVKLQIIDKYLLKTITKTINATKSAIITTNNPELLITDNSNSLSANKIATMRLIKSPEMLSCTGPFIVNTTHPLTDGLNFNSLIWAASTNITLNGAAIISAGNIPLLSITKENKNKLSINMQLDIARSNIQLTPAWPVLFWNLINWQLSQRNGFTTSNGRKDIPLKLRTMPDEKVIITEPDGKTTEHSTRSNQLLLSAILPGIYIANGNNWQSRTAINILNPSESNLLTAKSGLWGTFSTDKKYRDIQETTAPWFALAAILLLLCHHLIISPKPITGDRT